MSAPQVRPEGTADRGSPGVQGHQLRTSRLSTPNRLEPWSRQDLRTQHLHFIGVGGAGMSGLATLCSRLGASVSGSERATSAYLSDVQTSGVAVFEDLSLPPPRTTTVVYSSATPLEHVALTDAARRGLLVLHRAQLIAQILPSFTSIAVCGAHGKSSTTAMIAHILHETGNPAAVLVGAQPRVPFASVDSSVETVVLEADESDRSLLLYRPTIAVATNVDLDHVGSEGGYQSVSQVREVLAEFCNGADQAVLGPQARSLQSHLDVPSTLVSSPPLLANAGEAAHPTLVGTHMAMNAATAVAACQRLGVSPKRGAAALLNFGGLRRRFEVRGHTSQGAVVVDDYAHHPSEVAATIAAGRGFARGRLWAVFQPHLYSRTDRFGSDFVRVLGTADRSFTEPIFAARENGDACGQEADARWAATIASSKNHVELHSDRGRLAELLTSEPGEGDLILLMGAGDIGDLATALVRIPSER